MTPGLARTPVRPGPRLTLARAVAWSLLVSGWIGLGSFALVLAPGMDSAFALVALWLLLLGTAASVRSLAPARTLTRRLGLLVTAGLVVAGLWAAPRGAGLPALVLALVGWAALTAQASGVVRALRLTQAARPGPPIVAAGLGAAAAAVALGDPGNLQALSVRLAVLTAASGLALAWLQPDVDGSVAGKRCRAGLFDCSLPAWPAGAWRHPLQWPTLLAGVVMLPMMASLPLMVAWCRAEGIAPQAIVALHLAAMFGPALLLRHSVVGWSERRLSTVCAACLAAGAACVAWVDAPWSLLGLAVAHGAAWGLAWAGQLWAPERRGRAGTSPLRAAAGYAALTLAFGALVAHFGAPGVASAHAALGLAAALAWLVVAAASSSARIRRWREAWPIHPSSASARRRS